MSQRIDVQEIGQNGDTDGNAALYEIFPGSGVETLVASTPHTRKILREPEVRSVEFQYLLSQGLHSIIKSLLVSQKTQVASFLQSQPVDVLYILRGGLNFDLHTNLHDVTKTLPEVSFLSSQRIINAQGFSIQEASYQKWSIQDDALLCIGDISATATTILHALSHVMRRYNQQHKKPRWLLFVTIGASDVLDTMRAYQDTLQQMWGPQCGMTIVFIEQALSLYKGDTALEGIHLPHTDFFRKGYLSAPEFEYDSLSHPFSFLEQCAIYDGGSRAFEPRSYMEELHDYWKRLLDHAGTLPMDVLLRLKSNLLDYERPYDEWIQRGEGWHISEQRLHELYAKGQDALDFLHAHSLRELCEQRLHSIEQQMTNHR